jgi:hypothetical protein
MSDSFDSFEAELSTFVPCPVSPELRRQVAEHLAWAPSSRRRVWLISLGSGLAAACLLAAFLLWKGSRPVEPVLVVDPTPPAKAAENVQGTLLTYHRALSQSPEELDAKFSTFAWPIDGPRPMRVSTTIPTDLLD